jgi:hypothetical protein
MANLDPHSFLPTRVVHFYLTCIQLFHNFNRINHSHDKPDLLVCMGYFISYR